MTGSRNLGLLVLTAVVSAACSTPVVLSDPAAPVAAQIAVERFLKAANERDVVAMGNLFGTVSGPMIETGGTFGCAFKRIGSWFGGNRCRSKQEVEIQMEAIASILEHEDYRIVREERVAGRTVPTRRVVVDLTQRGAPVPAIPFVVVRTSEGRWLVQEIDLERVMDRGR